MPEKNGLEAIREIRTVMPLIPIIVMSANLLTGFRSDLLRIAKTLGASATLANPCSRDELLGTVGKHMMPADAPAQEP